MCQLQLLLLAILLITVLVSQNVIYVEYFMPMSHGVNKKAPTNVSPTLPITSFHRACCFTSSNLSAFFCSDLTDYCKNNAFSK